MTTPNDIDIRVGTSGTERTRRELRDTANEVGRLGSRVRRLALPLLGGTLLAGLLGGSLTSLALGGGAANDSIVRFQSSLERLSQTVLNAVAPALDWFTGLTEETQFAIFGLIGGVLLLKSGLGGLIGSAAGLLGVFAPLIAVAAVTLGVFYLLERQFGLLSHAANFLGETLTGILNIFLHDIPGALNTAINAILAATEIFGGLEFNLSPGDLLSGNFGIGFREGALTGVSTNFALRQAAGGPIPQFRASAPRLTPGEGPAMLESYIGNFLGFGAGDTQGGLPMEGVADARISPTFNFYGLGTEEVADVVKREMGDANVRGQVISGYQ